MAIKFKDVPTSFVCENWKKALDYCDNQTPMFCYCGKLATALHTNRCKTFIGRLQKFITERYKETIKQG